MVEKKLKWKTKENKLREQKNKNKSKTKAAFNPFLDAVASKCGWEGFIWMRVKPCRPPYGGISFLSQEAGR